ncbi:hypothetical protein [Kluyvera intermedia]|jgi:hypothetical protein|uniref:hypothetical protein n=1 Tax=Kluyvera intermedia TaxID=61648 RepID=UPI00242BBE62|nr:hypothetical protein [Kluyvera intermedia]WEJ84677.1 MAG: hypothetical protein P0Y47_00905 [Kluyvera intermedia]
MEKYADELCIMNNAIMNIIFSAGNENQCNTVFNSLHMEIVDHYFPESVKTDCLQAIEVWRAARGISDETEKMHLQQLAMLSLLAALGRVHALMAIEEYIMQKNTEVFGLR